jgi:hypothetical protein
MNTEAVGWGGAGAEAQEGVELIGVATLEEAVRHAFDDMTDGQSSGQCEDSASGIARQGFVDSRPCCVAEAENEEMEVSAQEDGEAGEEEEGHTDVEGGEGRRKRKHGEVEGTEQSGEAEGRKRRRGSGADENKAAERSESR